MSREPIDWDALMRLGLGVLRLSPEAFWSLSPRELARAVEGAAGREAGPAPLTRDGLARLMVAYPDRPRPPCREQSDGDG